MSRVRWSEQRSSLLLNTCGSIESHQSRSFDSDNHRPDVSSGPPRFSYARERTGEIKSAPRDLRMAACAPLS